VIILICPGGKWSISLANSLADEFSNALIYAIDDSPNCELVAHGIRAITPALAIQEYRNRDDVVLIPWCSDYALTVCQRAIQAQVRWRILITPDSAHPALFGDKLSYLKLLGSNVYSLDEYCDPTLPLVLKPRFGCGSRGIQFLSSSSSLNASSTEDHLILQQRYFGHEYSVEAVCLHGSIQIIAVSRRFMAGASSIAITSMDPADQVSQEIEAFVTQSLSSMFNKVGETGTFFIHLELIYDLASGAYQVIDFSARLGGFGLADRYLTHISGYDTLQTLKKTLSDDVPEDIVALKQASKSAALIFIPFQKGTYLGHAALDSVEFPNNLRVEIDTLTSCGQKMIAYLSDSHRILSILICWDSIVSHKTALHDIRDILSRYILVTDLGRILFVDVPEIQKWLSAYSSSAAKK